MIKIRPALSFLLVLILALPLSGCGGYGQNYKRPSGTPSKMSADTLCYRAESKSTEALQDEIRRRNLNCRAILENDPLLSQGQRY